MSTDPMLLTQSALARFPRVTTSDEWNALWNRAHTLADASKALEHPLDFPSIDQMFIPDDRIAIAVAPDAPNALDWVVALLRFAIDRGSNPHQFSIVLAPESASSLDRFRSALESFQLRPDAISIHDSHELQHLEYIGADPQAEPLYANRVLVEADVVVPIILPRHPCSFDTYGPQGIVPSFLDAASQHRIRGQFHGDPTLNALARSELGRDLAHLLGVVAVVACLPGESLDDSRCLVATPESLSVQMNPWIDLATANAIATPDLAMICAEMPDAEEGDWDALARTLSDYAPLLKREGVLVVSLPWKKAPIGALKMLASSDDPDPLEQKLLHSNLPFADAALAILRLQDRVRVYLWSHMRRESLENIGLGAITSQQEFERLASSCESGWTVSQAHRRYFAKLPSQPSL